MALISPTLDNRSFEQLRDELIKRIPVYAPEWTNHNASDPGIALLELFAYLGESLLYRFNQIPDTTKIEFLRLLGVQPRPAQPAQVLIAASTELPEGVQILKDTEAKAGAVSFQTTDEVYVWPLEVAAAGKTPVEPVETTADQERRDDALARANVTDPETAQFYETTLVPADPLAADAQPLDVSAQLDQALWIALLTKATTQFEKLQGQVLFVGIAFDETIPQPFALQNLDTAAEYQSTGLTVDPPPMLWRLWNGPADTRGDKPALTVVDIVGDTTQGLVTTGVVKVSLPAQLPRIGLTTAGDSDSPPPLTDDKLAARVVGWLQVTRPDTTTSGDSIHRVRWVGLNSVSAVQSRTAAAELLGTGTGDSDQRYPLNQRPVLPATVQLQVEELDGFRDWTEVETFVASGPDDRHYTVDHTAGAVSFGGTVAGRVPQIGERIRVLTYRYGGGVAGNVPAGAVTAVTGVAGVKVTNPTPAVGGADSVSLADALDAIPAEVHRRDRAVIAEDFRDLAAEVTGVARAETLPLLHPDTPLVQAAGVVSVVIFPDEDRRNPNAPSPDLGLLRRVANYLDQRRLVTTELYVIPPTYRQLSVSVGVQVREGYQVDAVRRWVELILRQYLAPLPPLGPDGYGWPLGRAVRRAELEAVAVQVEGVEFLQGLRLAVPSSTGPVDETLVTLQRWEAPELIDITVVGGGEPLPPGTPYAPPPPPKIPIPLPPDVC